MRFKYETYVWRGNQKKGTKLWVTDSKESKSGRDSRFWEKRRDIMEAEAHLRPLQLKAPDELDGLLPVSMLHLLVAEGIQPVTHVFIQQW